MLGALLCCLIGVLLVMPMPLSKLDCGVVNLGVFMQRVSLRVGAGGGRVGFE